MFTHRQWTYRNATAHYKPSEGKTVEEHTLIDQQVRSLQNLPISSLLRHHRHLITKEDFRKLLNGPTIAKQFWIAEVQSSLAEAALLCRLKKVNYSRGIIMKRRHNKIVKVPTVLSSLNPPSTSKKATVRSKKRPT